MCILLIHVDNIMVAASSREWFDEVIMKAWNKEFPVVYVSDTNLLGVHVERVAEDEMTFSQPHYVDKIVEAAGLKDDQKTVSVPITPDVNKRYDPADMKGDKSPADCPYRSLVMMLMWCARCYRHPLLYAACYSARLSSYYTQRFRLGRITFQANHYRCFRKSVQFGHLCYVFAFAHDRHELDSRRGAWTV